MFLNTYSKYETFVKYVIYAYFSQSAVIFYSLYRTFAEQSLFSLSSIYNFF